MSINLFQLEGRKEMEFIYFQELNSTFKYDWNHLTFPSNINSLLATHKNVPCPRTHGRYWGLVYLDFCLGEKFSFPRSHFD